MYINDITDRVKFSSLDLYADDLRIYKKILNPNDCIDLQEDINSIFQWSIDNNMDLHTDKCKVMSVGRGNSLFENNYFIHSASLSRVKVVRDLDIFFDLDWSFNSHINFVTSKALKLVGFIKRATFKFKSCLAVTCLYKSLVLPKLLYGSVIWNPYTDAKFSRLEAITKKFLRYASSKTNSPMIIYHDYRAISLTRNIHTIESHNITDDLIFVYKFCV